MRARVQERTRLTHRFAHRCVLELHAIAMKKKESGGRFFVAMTALEKQRFLDGISVETGAYYNMLGRVNVERSECSRAADRESIHAGIRDSVGFGALGRMVFGVMEECMVEELRAQVAAMQRDGDESREMKWSCVMGSVLRDQGRHGEAVEFEERALDISRRVLPPGHPNIITYMSNLANTYTILGRNEDALTMKECVLEFRRRVLPPDDPEIGHSMNNLATTYNILCRHEDALAMQQSALEFLRRVLRPDHPDIGITMCNLASTYCSLDRYEDALTIHQSAMEFLGRVLPPGHPHIAFAMYNISLTHERVGDMRRAMDCAREALIMWQAALPPGHPYLKLAEKQVNRLEKN